MLELVNTAGSAENLKLLGSELAGVDVAFVQGSMKSLVQNTDLVSLGSLFFEPLWVFHRGDLTLRRLPDLKGLRLAVGEEGSRMVKIFVPLPSSPTARRNPFKSGSLRNVRSPR